MPRALKVYRTSAGFHDAYVAASSQKAALEAWGADSNLFTTGSAELVTDPKLTKGPLAKPGVVIKLARGSTAQHLAALPKSTESGSRGNASLAANPFAKANPGPRPLRRQLDAAEKAVERAELKFAKEADALRKREEELRDAKRKLSSQREATLENLNTAVNAARSNTKKRSRRGPVANSSAGPVA